MWFEPYFNFVPIQIEQTKWDKERERAKKNGLKRILSHYLCSRASMCVCVCFFYSGTLFSIQFDWKQTICTIHRKIIAIFKWNELQIIPIIETIYPKTERNERTSTNTCTHKREPALCVCVFFCVRWKKFSQHQRAVSIDWCICFHCKWPFNYNILGRV